MASSVSNSRRKHRMSLEVRPRRPSASRRASSIPSMTSANRMPLRVCAWGSKNTSACKTVCYVQMQLRFRQLLDKLGECTHCAAAVVDRDRRGIVSHRSRRSPKLIAWAEIPKVCAKVSRATSILLTAETSGSFGTQTGDGARHGRRQGHQTLR